MLLLLAEKGAWGNGGGEPRTHTGDYTIQNWQLEQGLPQISVTAIAQTTDGYLWVGTFHGLARFDGVRFKVFTEGNTPALGNNGITGLEVDQRGTLWIVTLAGGLVRMAGGTFTLFQKDQAQLLLSGDRFSRRSRDLLLLLDEKGSWHRIVKDQLMPLGQADVVDGDAGPTFLFLNTCASWIAQRDKILHSFQSAVPVLVSQGSNHTRVDLTIHSAAASKSGNYWVATSDGVYRMRQGQLSARVAPLPTVGAEQLLMQEDGQGDLWAGKWGEGVFRLDAKAGWQQYSAGEGLADNHVNCLFQDREGSLWIGTGQGGLHRVRPSVFKVYDTEGGPDVVMSVTQDRQSRMWFGINGGGLHTWEGKRLKPVTRPAILPRYPLAYSVLADRQNTVWIGLYGVRALRWQGDEVTVHNLDDGSLRPMTPKALYEDRNGAIWLGCTRSLLRYERNGTFTRYTMREGLTSDTVVALAEDRTGTMYIGTDGGGLNCIRQGRFTSLTERDGLADNHVASLYVDSEDTLWIGTVDHGLSRFKHGKFHTAGLKDGLPTETIGGMVEDDLGNLWLGSNRGIIRVNRRALNDYLDRRGSAAVFDLFGLSDGLGTAGCAGASQPACCKAMDGKLWFCTIKGVAVVDPRDIPLNQLPPPVVLEEAVLDDEVHLLTPTTEAARLTVPARTHRVEFRFTGLSLVAPEKVRFRYQLAPFDNTWVEAETRRIAHYTGIPPGHYQFRVRACNNDGVWNETGASLGVVVLPLWRATWWFRALAALSLAGLVFGWYEWRLRRLRRERLAQEGFSRQLIATQESERRRIAGELHDGMGQDLLVIANQAQLSLSREANPPGTVARLNEIAETAKRALQQARRMAHNLRPGLLEELGFAEAIQASAEKAARAAGISLKLALANVDGLLPPEFEVNLFRIVQEALNNVLKHAGASELRITLSHEPDALRLIVEDNGRGFEPGLLDSAHAGQRGLGVRQICERARMLGGRADLQSRPDHGTRLTVTVPLEPC